MLGLILGRVPAKVWIGLAAVITIAGAVWWIDSSAFKRGKLDERARWEAASSEEVLRQTGVNRAAYEAALEQIENLKRSKAVRDATIERLNREAAESDNAGRESLDAGSVRRLNGGGETGAGRPPDGTGAGDMQ